MLAYYLHDLSPFILEFRSGLGIRWYGAAYVLAFLAGYRLYRWLALRGYTEMPPDQVGDFITWAAVFGVMLGGRLGWTIFYGWHEVLADPLTLLRVWEGGMSSHGGILGLVLFTLFWAKRHRLSWTSIGDSLCVVAPLGLFLVRCANFINGELFGKPAGLPGGVASVPWAVLFPSELQDSAVTSQTVKSDPLIRQFAEAHLTPRHPSQLYEALLEGVVLFAILWFLRTRVRVPRGIITGAFFVLYATLRIIGEVFREPDPAWAVGRISAGQFLSLFLYGIGAAFLVWGWRTQHYESAPAAPPATPN